MSMDHILSAALAQPDSPFIEGTTIQYAWDSVSLTSFLSCPRRYQYQIIEGLVPNSTGYAIALVFGILFHKGLEEYHREKTLLKAGGMVGDEDAHEAALLHAVRHLLNDQPATATLPTDEVIEEMAENYDPDEDDGIQLRNSKVRTRYYLIRAVVWYLEHYKDDPCSTIIMPSGAPAVELSFRIPLPIDIASGAKHHQLMLCGHIDRGIEFNGHHYPDDYKTAKSITQQWKEMFDLSHQMTGYSVAGSILFEAPVIGAMIDGIALQIGQCKFNRHFTTRSEGQVQEYFELLGYVAQQAERHYLSGSYPMNTASCYFCEFKQVCRTPPEYRDRYISQHYSRKPGWNPLENR